MSNFRSALTSRGWSFTIAQQDGRILVTWFRTFATEIR